MDIQDELKRQTSYIIAIHQQSDTFAIENSIELAKAYVEKFPSRKAVIISDNYRNPRLDKIAYNQVQTFKKGTLRLVDKKDNQNKTEVLQTVCTNVKNGLLVIDNYAVTEDILKEMLYKQNKGQDVIIHRNQFLLNPIEIDYINEQINAIESGGPRPLKAIHLRLHCFDNFVFKRDELLKLIELFGQELGGLIFLSEYVLLRMRNEFVKLLQAECFENDEQFEHFIDPFYLKKDTSNYVYINILKQEIVGADLEFLQKCQTEIAELLQNEQI